MLIDGSFVVRAPPEQVLARLFDARAMASCLPGCESIEALSNDRYHAIVAVALAGVKARFDLQVEITSREPDGVRAMTRGEEGGNASTLEATSDVRLSAGAEFIVVVCGEIMTMPGLPKVPSANSIKLNAQGQIEGLF